MLLRNLAKDAELLLTLHDIVRFFGKFQVFVYASMFQDCGKDFVKKTPAFIEGFASLTRNEQNYAKKKLLDMGYLMRHPSKPNLYWFDWKRFETDWNTFRNTGEKAKKKVNKTEEHLSEEEKQINDVISVFYDNGNRAVQFNNKGQRNAAKWLVKEETYDGAKALALKAMSLVSIPYAPKAVTPVQLKEKLVRVKNYETGTNRVIL